MFSCLDRVLVSFRAGLLMLTILAVAGCSASPEERAQRHYQRGMEYLKEQNYSSASLEFRNALQLQKNFVDAWRGLARVEERNQNWQGLASILRTVVELDKEDANTRVRLARLLALGNDFESALALANKAGEIDDRLVDVYVTRAIILYRLGDLAGAIRESQMALEIDSTNMEALMVLAAERLTRRDTEGALRILERGPATQATDIGVQLFKMRIYEQAEDTEQVEGVLRKLTELYPKQQQGFRRQLIRYYIKQERHDKAEEELRALAADPNDREAARSLVGFIQKFKGQKAARDEIIARINAGGPQTFQYQMLLADFDSAHGDDAASVKLLEELARLASREEALTAKVKLAEIHASRKRIDAAEQVVGDILRRDSGNVDGLRLRAVVRIEQGRLEDAIADVRAALDSQPRSARLMLLLATAYERSGSMELAERQYAQATQASEFDPTIGLSYVGFLRRRGNISRTEEILSDLASRRPDNINVLSGLAEVKLMRADWAGAAEVSQRMRRIGNAGAVADQVLGLSFSGQNQLDEGIQALQRAYTAEPDIGRMNALVATFIRAKQYDRAEAFLKSVLSTSPNNAQAYALLGSVHLAKNTPNEAISSFRKAIDVQPKNTVGYQALANFHVREKNFKEATKYLTAGLEQQPNDFNLRLIYAGVLENEGDFEGAIAEYERLLKNNSASLVIANNLASLLSDRRNDKESLERAYSLSAILRKTEAPHFKDTVGWIYYLRGDYRNALVLLEDAASSLPALPTVRYHLAMAYIATEQVEKATRELKAAIALNPDGELAEKIRKALDKATM